MVTINTIIKINDVSSISVILGIICWQSCVILNNPLENVQLQNVLLKIQQFVIKIFNVLQLDRFQCQMNYSHDFSLKLHLKAWVINGIWNKVGFNQNIYDIIFDIHRGPLKLFLIIITIMMT